MTTTHAIESFEQIWSASGPLAYVIRSGFAPAKTQFMTPNEFNQQVGFIVYPAGGVIPRHVHRRFERKVYSTSEVLVIRSGRCEMEIYDNDKQLVATRELSQGDVVILISGGHGFRVLEDTVFLEIKQGPYTGLEEKERF